MCYRRRAFAGVILCAIATAAAQVPTSTSLSVTSAAAPVSTVQQGVAVTLTATVSLAAGGTALPPGQVNFCEVKALPLRCTDLRLLGTVQLTSAGAASFKFFPGSGTHIYQAVFLGTHRLAPSSSAAASLTVTPHSPTVNTLTVAGLPGDYTLYATVTNSIATPPTGTVDFLDLGNSGYVIAAAPLVPVASSGLTFVDGPQIPATITTAEVIAAGDFNGDGRPDMVLGTDALLSVPALIGVFLSNGDTTFSPRQSSAIAGVSQSIAVADFNGDGKLDVATATNSVNQVQVLLGNGDGTFTIGPVTSLPSPQALAVADFNGDGIPDLAVTNVLYSFTGPPATINTVSILLGNGDGTFTLKSTTSTGTNPSSLAVGDFNGDGIPDLAIANQADNTVTILLGKGDGTFIAAPTLLTGSAPTSIVAADLNGDGILDLAVANGASFPGQPAPGSVTILLGNGNGTFTPAAATLATGVDPVSIAFGDFNGDGKPDLVIANAGPTSSGLNTASILLGNGDGTFAAAINQPAVSGVSSVPTSVATADFNGAGASGMAVAALYGLTTVIFPQTGSTATALAFPISPIGTGGRVIQASYLGDGDNDPSLSNTVQIVAQPVSTTVAVAANPSTINYGQQLLLTAVISPASAEGITPTGLVAISYAGIKNLVPLSGGFASLNLISPPVGVYNVTASYSGDSNFLPSSGSATITVEGLATNVAVMSSLNPAGLGQSVTFTATVTSPAGPPGGSILFTDGAATLASLQLTSSGAGSTASFTTSTLALGTHVITATYVPATGYAAGSATLSQVITPPVADFTITLANPTQTLQDGQQSTTTITLTSLNSFADTLTLACSSLPPDLACSPSPSSIKLAANAKASVSLTLTTYISVQARNGSAPAPAAPRPSLLSLALLLPPAGVFTTLTARRRLRSSILNLLLLAAFSAVALSLSGCGEIIYQLPSVAPGIYTIPIVATGATGLSHTAALTLTVTTP